MSLINIKARFSCDRCGQQFYVGMEPSYQPPSAWSLHDAAEDAIRGGNDYQSATDNRLSILTGSVGTNGEHYCAPCTRILDREQDGEETDNDVP